MAEPAPTVYRVVKAQPGNGWNVETDGSVGSLAYITKEAALEAIVPAAGAAMSEGRAVAIEIPGGSGRWPVDP